MAPSVVLVNGQNQLVSVAVGTNFSLVASITRFNLNLTSVIWTHNGSSNISRANTMEHPDQTSVTVVLQRHSAIPLDAGLYVVTATNPVGNATIEFDVIVTGKLYILIRP